MTEFPDRRGKRELSAPTARIVTTDANRSRRSVGHVPPIGGGPLPESTIVRPPTSSTRRAVLGVAATAIVLVACRDDDGGGSTDEFCAQVTEHQAVLFQGPAEQTRRAYEDLVELYRDIGERAPLAIEEEWTAMAGLWETALEEADEQEVLRRAFTSERDAVAVVDWVEENCGVTVPLATVPPLVAPPGTEPAAADG